MGVDTEGAKFPEAKISEASFLTANLFTANFPRHIIITIIFFFEGVEHKQENLCKASNILII